MHVMSDRLLTVLIRSLSNSVHGIRTGLIGFLILMFPLSVRSIAQNASAGPPPAIPVDTETLRKQGIEYFEKHVRPLLVQRCYACHSEAAGKQEGGLLLDSEDGWMRGGSRGAVVRRGDPEGSLIVHAVRYSDPELEMPPTERLNDLDIVRLTTWISMGAPMPEKRNLAVDAAPADPEAGKSHWAFRPLQPSSIPEVQDSGWPLSDIDRFVLSGLESRSMRPVDDAEADDLLRRVCFLLVGLPPTQEQRERFRTLPQTRAMEQLVDELLASPEFGRRWGRHWLDLARYADSNGLDENFLFREAWRYRNWVIDAVNADMPFDRFILEQIAGDLLPYESIGQRDRQRIAAGFLVVGPKVLLGVNPQRQIMDVADEQLDSIGRAVLGQTLGCARCHDHKFDPVPTADYYALAGIFTSTNVMEQRFMLNEQRVMEQLIGLGADGERLDAEYEEYWRQRPGRQRRLDKARTVLELLRRTETPLPEQQTADNAGAFADAAADPNVPHETRLAAQQALIDELQKLLSDSPTIPPRAMIPSDRDKPADESIRITGDFSRKGDPVSRGFLRVLCDDETPVIPQNQSGRIELAQWLTDPAGRAGALTARVQANRIWYHLFGRGLVRTVDNFGRTGEMPDHPELLEYLAGELVRDGWSFKSLIRKIALSRTFALSSRFDADNYDLDPENVLLWRAARRRLDPESLRDAMLSAAGMLDLSPADSTVSYLGDQATAVGGNEVRRRTDFPYRSVYLPVVRNDLPEIFEAFDFTNPHATTGMRPNTTSPTQGLFMMNDSMVMDAATAVARRVTTDSSQSENRIRSLFLIVTGSEPSPEETDALRTYIDTETVRLTSPETADAEFNVWVMVCHALFASSRFQFLN